MNLKHLTSFAFGEIRVQYRGSEHTWPETRTKIFFYFTPWPSWKVFHRVKRRGLENEEVTCFTPVERGWNRVKHVTLNSLITFCNWFLRHIFFVFPKKCWRFYSPYFWPFSVAVSHISPFFVLHFLFGTRFLNISLIILAFCRAKNSFPSLSSRFSLRRF